MQSPRPASLRIVLLALFFIILAICGLIAALSMTRPGSSGGSLAIQHTPPTPPLMIATPITLTADVTGSGLSSVELLYKVTAENPSGGGLVEGTTVTASMLLEAAGGKTYSYTIPADEISGRYIDYSITAADSYGNNVHTPTYTLSIADFAWQSDTTTIVITRTLTKTVQIGLTPINGFDKPVKIVVSENLPLGVQVVPAHPQVTPSQSVSLSITSTSDAQTVSKYDVVVDAVYSPSATSALRIVRSTTLQLTVTDFWIDVTPNRIEINRDDNAMYTLTMKVFNGFTVPNGFNTKVTGIPSNADWRLELVRQNIAPDGTSTFTYNLVIVTYTNTDTGTYLFNVSITATTADGNVTHSANNLQLEIDS